jgi:hypothetical protein
MTSLRKAEAAHRGHIISKDSVIEQLGGSTSAYETLLSYVLSR